MPDTDLILSLSKDDLVAAAASAAPGASFDKLRTRWEKRLGS
jgi:hypothetical protein